jgi:hypothetical protein
MSQILGLINIKTTGIDTMFQSECVYRFSYIYAFLKNNLVNLSREKIAKVDTMPNLLHREINSFWRRYHSLLAGKH